MSIFDEGENEIKKFKKKKEKMLFRKAPKTEIVIDPHRIVCIHNTFRCLWI